MSGDMPSGSVATPRSGIIGACSWCGGHIFGVRLRINQRFCCAQCRVAHYDKHHPRIAAPGTGNRQVPIKARIQAAMTDGFWRTTAQLAYELRESEGTVSRKLRQLRAEGFVIESRTTASSSRAPHEFRLMLVGAVPEVRA